MTEIRFRHEKRVTLNRVPCILSIGRNAAGLYGLDLAEFLRLLAALQSPFLHFHVSVVNQINVVG